jgi:hypothetical protein
VAADPLTRSTADAVLKEFYLPGIRSILNNELFLLSQVETNSEDIEGRRAVLAINTGRNQGIGARAEMGTLPDAGHQTYNEERISLKYNYGRIQLSGPVIRSMGSDRGSFTRAIQSETQGVTRDLRNDVNRQLYAGGVGTIAVLSAAPPRQHGHGDQRDGDADAPAPGRHVGRHRHRRQPDGNGAATGRSPRSTSLRARSCSTAPPWRSPLPTS